MSCNYFNIIKTKDRWNKDNIIQGHHIHLSETFGPLALVLSRYHSLVFIKFTYQPILKIKNIKGKVKREEVTKSNLRSMDSTPNLKNLPKPIQI